MRRLPCLSRRYGPAGRPRSRQSSSLAEPDDPRDHPVRAGSATDVIPRIVFEPLAAQLGQPIVVENRAARAARIGAAAVAKAEPDGYTLLAHSNAHTIAPRSTPISPTIRPAISPDQPFGAVPERADHRAVEGHQDHPGVRRRRQGQARQLQLRVGRRRLRHALSAPRSSSLTAGLDASTSRSRAAPRR